ncbi:type VI secretion system-associated FHA domain protein TagH [uncultured Roseobacter sp.]|uniref:type VI secretion system-associated FHA domain protein TagH n=1 Tax=uncultured Roseobacter sp. TaxID=114847 RepID=UPI002601FBEB|nr:type VI secretion system-associated FHA domain protein TagH [uncultured Roseobacter sp.]
MSLTLTAHDTDQDHAAPIEVTMTGNALRVGREADNDLTLPDPDRVLSKRHCLLERQGEGYVLRDTSINGTFLNYQPERIGDTATVLKTGDVILVGTYELVVEIGAMEALNKDAAPSAMPPVMSACDTVEDDNAFLDDLLRGGDAEADPFAAAPSSHPHTGGSAADHSPAMQDHFAAPKVQAPVIPDDWDAEISAPSRTPAAPVRSATPGDALEAFATGLGMADLHIPEDQAPEVMGRVGRVMAAMISGLRDVMMTRTALKSEMRVARTMIAAEANNPLKFSVSAEQAIEAMIGPARPGYQDPEAATAEVLRDIKAHEIATMTGLQAAIKDLLTQLSPDALQSDTHATGPLARLSSRHKARAWDAYEARYARIAREAEEDFQGSFLRAFASAYEQQISKL